MAMFWCFMSSAATDLLLGWCCLAARSCWTSRWIYLRDVKPVLSARCFSCHGAVRQKARLRLDAASLIRKGGRSGPALVPGKADESLLVKAVLGKDRLVGDLRSLADPGTQQGDLLL